MQNNITKIKQAPLILAPAGNRASFFAALAAGADAIYCGLKNFSARMEAKNFTIEELIPLTRLAHTKKTSVYITLNSLVKPDDLYEAGILIKELATKVKPDALIVQDPAIIELARASGFSGKIHLSTLSNTTFSRGLKVVREKLGVSRVVLPRELNIDEIKILASSCPKDLDLEIFIHGALCYGISGRCYWSSFFGGKSGLRGRCVQPCRRLYTQQNQRGRLFSCLDLSLDVLVKILLDIPQVRVWKIEGRKKSPHYVFYTVKGYQILRDYGKDAKKKKVALDLLAFALGRTGTHYNFLPQRPQNPLNKRFQTGSGFFLGKIKGSRQKPYLVPREELLPSDVLRIGYEDEYWHSIQKVNQHIPKKGRLYIKCSKGKNPAIGTSVFLTDRREQKLNEYMTKLEEELLAIKGSNLKFENSNLKSINHLIPLKKSNTGKKAVNLNVYRWLSKGELHRHSGTSGLWLSSDTANSSLKNNISKLWWWLPPVIWPEDEQKFEYLLNGIVQKGGINFVLNSPWQIGFFKSQKGFNLWAGPFCNISNRLSVKTLFDLGFTGAIVSPELGKEDYLKLSQNSLLPLGIVISGNWPLCISRTVPDYLDLERPFNSPKGESAWIKKYTPDYWIFPNWKINLLPKKSVLEKAGYSLFVNLIEPVPKEIKLKKREGLWNWNHGLL